MTLHFMTPLPSGGSAPFTPATISGLLLWVDANDTATMTLDGSNRCSQIVSKDSGSKTYTQGTLSQQPVYTASVINGKGALAFSKPSSQKVVSSGASFRNTTQPFTVLFVGQCTDAAVFPIGFNIKGTSGTDAFQIGTSTNASYNDYYFGNAGNPERLKSATTTNWNAIMVTTDGAGTWTGYINRVAGTVSASGATAAASENVIGSYTAGADPSGWDGYIGLILVYDHVLTAPELTQLNSYISSQFAL